MTLEAETGSGSSTANSYVTLAVANDYFTRHLSGTAWAAKTDAEKETLLITAARAVDYGATWKGRKITITQAMQWPREDVETQLPWPDTLYPNNAVPPQVKAAQIEVAALFLNGDRFADQDADGISSVSLGKGALAVTFDANTAKSILGRVAPLLLAEFAHNSGTKRGAAPIYRM